MVTPTIKIVDWKSAFSGAYGTSSDWSPGVTPDDALGATTDYDVFIGGSGVTTGSGAFTVTSSANELVDSLDIGAANATLSITGQTFTVNRVAAFDGDDFPSTAYDLGTISIGAGAKMVFGASTGSAAAPINYSYSGEIFDTGGKVNIASGGTLLLNEPWFKFISNGAQGAVTLTGSAVIEGATTIGGTLENVNNLIQGAGVIGNGSGTTSSGGLNFQNDAGGVINANSTTAMTINTGSAYDENSGTIESTGTGGLNIDSNINQFGQLIAGRGTIAINNANVGGNGGNDIVKSGAQILLNASQLTTGGTISVAAGGLITTSTATGNAAGIGSNNHLTGDALSSGEIENSGTIEVANGTTLNLNASVYDNAVGSQIWLDSTGAATTLEIYGNGASIYGAGGLVLSNNADNSVVANGAGLQLSDYGAISGAGTIGDGNLRLYVSSSGVVNANDSTLLTIAGDATAANAGSESSDYSAGLIETTGAGGLTINVDKGGIAKGSNAPNVFGNAGAIDATGKGVLTLENGTLLDGGVLQTTAAGASIVFHNFASYNNAVKIVKGSSLSTAAGDAEDELANLFNYGTIVIAEGSTLDAFNTWLNAGVVNLNGAAPTNGGSTSQAATLEISGLTLTGGGTINLNSAYDVIAGNATNAQNGTAWFGNMNNTIQGWGVIGALNGLTNLNLQNNGTIDGTGAAGATLTIDTGAQTINNNGTIESTGAGGLTIIGSQGTQYQQGVDLNQNGNLIAAAGALTLENDVAQGAGNVEVTGSGGSIVLDNSSLTSWGIVSVAAGGNIVAEAGTTDQLEPQNDMENAGVIQVQDGATLDLNVWLNNTATGAIDIGDANGGGTLKILGWGAQFNGGAVNLSDNSHNLIASGASDEYLWSTATITGDGTIGDANLCFQNLSGGVVDANDKGGLTIVADVVTNSLNNTYNSGTIETTGAGNLTLNGALDVGTQNFANAGIINEAGSGTLTFDAIQDTGGGGTVEATGTGKLVLEDDSIISHGFTSVATGATIATTGDDAIESNLSLAGTVDVGNDSTLLLEGHWEGSGSLELGTASGGSADLTLESNNALQLQGGGTLLMNGLDDAIGAQAPTSGNTTLLKNISDTISGSGAIGDANLTLQNEASGVIDATGAMTLNTGDDTIFNAGLIEATSGTGITIDSQINNVGSIVANAGTIDFNAAVDSYAGVATVDGTGAAGTGGTIEIGAAFDNDVFFGTGSAAGGTLILDHSATDAPSAIFGFDGASGGKDTIDLKDISFASATFSYAGGALDGVLTVTDGPNTASLYMVGDYTPASFKLATDGHGGALLT